MSLLQGAVGRVAGSRAVSRLARWVNTTVRPPRPIRISVEGEHLYAARLDRLAALLIRKASGAESFETDLWKSLVAPGAVVADVGANLGLFALLAGRRAGPAGRVEAFEPDALNFDMLSRATAGSGLANVTPRRMAVSDEDGTATLYVRPEHNGDHRLYRHAFEIPGGDRNEVVPVCQLDTFFADGRLDAVKIDVQGLEWKVLRGMRQLIVGNPGLVILCEFWPRGLGESGGSAASFLQECRDAGLNLFHVDNDRRSVTEASDADLLATCEGDRFTNLLLKRGSL